MEDQGVLDSYCALAKKVLPESKVAEQVEDELWSPSPPGKSSKREDPLEKMLPPKRSTPVPKFPFDLSSSSKKKRKSPENDSFPLKISFTKPPKKNSAPREMMGLTSNRSNKKATFKMPSNTPTHKRNDITEEIESDDNELVVPRKSEEEIQEIEERIYSDEEEDEEVKNYGDPIIDNFDDVNSSIVSSKKMEDEIIDDEESPGIVIAKSHMNEQRENKFALPKTPKTPSFKIKKLEEDIEVDDVSKPIIKAPTIFVTPRKEDDDLKDFNLSPKLIPTPKPMKTPQFTINRGTPDTKKKSKMSTSKAGNLERRLWQVRKMYENHSLIASKLPSKNILLWVVITPIQVQRQPKFTICITTIRDFSPNQQDFDFLCNIKKFVVYLKNRDVKFEIETKMNLKLSFIQKSHISCNSQSQANLFYEGEIQVANNYPCLEESQLAQISKQQCLPQIFGSFHDKYISQDNDNGEEEMMFTIAKSMIISEKTHFNSVEEIKPSKFRPFYIPIISISLLVSLKKVMEKITIIVQFLQLFDMSFENNRTISKEYCLLFVDTNGNLCFVKFPFYATNKSWSFNQLNRGSIYNVSHLQVIKSSAT